MSPFFRTVSVKRSKNGLMCRMILTPKDKPEIEIMRRCAENDLPDTLRYMADMIDGMHGE